MPAAAAAVAAAAAENAGASLSNAPNRMPTNASGAPANKTHRIERSDAEYPLTHGMWHMIRRVCGVCAVPNCSHVGEGAKCNASYIYGD